MRDGFPNTSKNIVISIYPTQIYHYKFKDFFYTIKKIHNIKKGGIFIGLFKWIKNIGNKLALRANIGSGISGSYEQIRSELLKSYNYVYESAMLEIRDPPSNTILHHLLVESFNRAGFEATSNIGPRFEPNVDQSSRSQIPFSGVISGGNFTSFKAPRIFKYISIILSIIFLVGFLITIIDFFTGYLYWRDRDYYYIFTGVSFVVLLIWIVSTKLWILKKKLAIKGIVAYFGINEYDLVLIEGSDPDSNPIIDVDAMKFATYFHPQRTIIRVLIGFQISKKYVLNQKKIDNRFEFLKTLIEGHLQVQPIALTKPITSNPGEPKTLFRRDKKSNTLKNIESRFPY